MTGGDLVVRVESAIAELARSDRPVTFTAVADRAGVARATLYRNPTLRAIVNERRIRQLDAHSLSGLGAEVSHMLTALEAMAERVRDHEERLRLLERRSMARSS